MSFSSVAKLTSAQALAELKSSPGGLRAGDAHARLEQYGRNELASEKLRWQKILLRQFRSPFLYLLVAAATLSFLLREFIDAAMIALFVLINASLGFIQEYQSERAIELLRKFVVARMRVKRDGEIETIDTRELVPGDIVVLETGDHLRADVRFIEADGLVLDESVLTGESEPVSKNADPVTDGATEIYQAKNIGFAGTSLVSGRALGLVIATGGQTEIGEISHLTAASNGASTFEKGILEFSRFILWTILVTLAVVFAANIIVKGPGVNIPELLIFSIALAVSVVPEALPVVTTMTLSRGAVRLAKNNVVTKRLSAVEDLGSIEVLCTDKTGTLTENKMNVASVYGDKDDVLEAAALGAPAFGEGKHRPTNPFDIAIWEKFSPEDRAQIAASPRAHETPFDPAKRWNSAVVEWKRSHRLIVRGAPEELARLAKLPAAEREQLLTWTEKEGLLGRRVLAVAVRRVPAREHPSPEDGGLTFLGAVSFLDPIKKTSRSSIWHAKELGVQVKILTGDSPGVAGAVGAEIGLVSSPDEVLTGAQWSAMSHEQHIDAAEKYNVFARVSPTEKYEIIETLQRKYEVGFLGEGINDAPALKIANVGIVVDGASDIAREAADVILLKHSLEVIVSGIREGREVFANTVKYIKATLASNFGNFLAVAASTLLIDYLPMLPVQILLVNLLSDFPMILIATDNVDPEELRRPHAYEVLRIVYVSAVIGTVSTIFDFIFFAVFSHGTPATLQTNWFVGSILTELVLIFSIRTRKLFWKAKPAALGLTVLSATAFLATIIIPYLPIGHNLFQFISPSRGQMTLVLGIVAVYFVTTETVKLLYYRYLDRPTAADSA